jgi:threonine aldolase
MRQVGVLCAAANYALDHHLERLAEDHSHARRLAEGLAALPGLSIDLESVQTNIVIFDVRALAGASTDLAAEFVRRAAAVGVRLNAVGPSRVRAVTHLDLSAHQVEAALSAFASVVRAA